MSGGNCLNCSTKTCLFPGRGKNTTRSFNRLSCSVFNHFETTDVNGCAHGDWCDKLPNFRAWSFAGPKRNFLGFWVGACVERVAQMSQFRAMGVISVASQHPKDVPFVGEFWQETHSLGDMTPRKQGKFYDVRCRCWRCLMSLTWGQQLQHTYCAYQLRLRII